MRFEPFTNASLDIFQVGQERSPVIQIDGVLRDPSALVQYAVDEAQFETVGSNLYPGVRAAMPLDYVEGVVKALDSLILKTYNIANAKLAKAECFFSIVTKRPDQLRPLQKVPHIDTTDKLHFAVVHFLCAASFGGTAFFRQKITGYETITVEREMQWAKERDKALALMPDDAGYIAETSPDYEQIGLVTAKFDRLTLYRSNLLHSGFIPPDMSFSPDPMVGRLTANFFISYSLV